jgi:hypothetical protein
MASKCLNREPETRSTSFTAVGGDRAGVSSGVESAEKSSSKTSGKRSSSEINDEGVSVSRRLEREDLRGHEGYAQDGEVGFFEVAAATVSIDNDRLILGSMSKIILGIVASTRSKGAEVKRRSKDNPGKGSEERASTMLIYTQGLPRHSKIHLTHTSDSSFGRDSQENESSYKTPNKTQSSAYHYP